MTFDFRINGENRTSGKSCKIFTEDKTFFNRDQSNTKLDSIGIIAKQFEINGPSTARGGSKSTHIEVKPIIITVKGERTDIGVYFELILRGGYKRSIKLDVLETV